MSEDRTTVHFSEEEAAEELKKGYTKAEKLLRDQDRLERFLQKLEKKLRTIPNVGDILASVPILISMVRSYIKREYIDLPVGTIVAIVSALIYVISLFDIIPDALPAIGFTDDTAVVAFCLKRIGEDVSEYLEWRDATGRTLDV